MLTLRDVQAKIGSGLILIGHDMGLMAQSVDEHGRPERRRELVESLGQTAQINQCATASLYTRDLISSPFHLWAGRKFSERSEARAVAPKRRQRWMPLLLELEDCQSKTYGAR